MVNVYTFMPARNEEENLPACLDSLLNQTVVPSKILVINDASIDRTKEVAESYGCDVINLTEQHESYTLSVEDTWKFAKIWNNAFPTPKNTDYLMQTAPDIILPRDYIERLTELMEQDNRLVIASGMVEGEHTLKSHVRGVGRLYKVWFWNKYIKKFPLTHGCESYPLYKALALGLKVQHFPEIIMKAQRPTKMHKGKYGYAMRELGYFPPFALAKCFLSFLFSRKDGIIMFKTYLTSPFKPKDKDIQSYLRLRQIYRILHLKESLSIWVSRI